MALSASVIAQTQFPDDSLGDAVITAPPGMSTYIDANHPPVVSYMVSSVPTVVSFPLDKVSWIRIEADSFPEFTCVRTANRDTLRINCTSLGSGGSYVLFTGIQ